MKHDHQVLGRNRVCSFHGGVDEHGQAAPVVQQSVLNRSEVVLFLKLIVPKEFSNSHVMTLAALLDKAISLLCYLLDEPDADLLSRHVFFATHPGQ